MSTTDNDLLEELRTEAIDTVEDRLRSLTEAVQDFQAGIIQGNDALAAIRLEAHSLKSVAQSFEMKSLKVMCHRFEDYFFNMKELTPESCKDILFYADRMAECLEAFIQNREIDVSQMMRKLPNKGGFNVGDITVTDIEVMLVMEPGIATKIVTRELLECGYRMINVASTMDAIQLIPSMRPDAVIVSRVMPELTGIDLACALKAMPSTRDIPVALIATSQKEKYTDLPADVPVLRKGANFADDVADVFVKLGIL
ncbi:Hpt domain-containing protein [Kordiimonas lacus]|uniref:Response regulator receiver domain-containing protein n=1 Tax=Kordiimonas lacus TaxID=637679 RepID=A0A1G7C3Z5_9PROT|nr:Hpt domain-containing protein [Kordiimonas lacus]SDE34031.1 Response regulator receiver domain-containing protein [Kordiimonas lacus]